MISKKATVNNEIISKSVIKNHLKNLENFSFIHIRYVFHVYIILYLTFHIMMLIAYLVLDVKSPNAHCKQDLL